MKLKNIIIALSVLVAFSACSNDDNNLDPNKKAKSFLSIQVASKGISTTAVNPNDPHELEGEANINTLSTFVFDVATKERVGFEKATLPNVSHEHTVAALPVVGATGPVAFVLVANAPLELMDGITTYSQLEEALAQLSAQEQTNLTMSTPLITTASALEVGDNFVGFEGETNINNINEALWLTRIPARLELVAIRTNFSRQELAGRVVTVNSISYSNVKSESSYFSVADWGVVETEGSFTSASLGRPALVVGNTTPAEELAYINYVMENLNTEERPTTLLINATLSAGNGYQAETVNFAHAINWNGIAKGENHDYVKRNYVYRLTATFGDGAFTGTNEEDPGPVDPVYQYLDVEVEVVGWGEVDQPVEI